MDKQFPFRCGIVRNVCFENRTELIPYTNESTFLFGMHVTQEHLLILLIPCHYFANDSCMSCEKILDNNSAFKLPDELMNEYKCNPPILLSPSVTSKFQPADIGNIACIKLGIRSLYWTSCLLFLIVAWY